MSDEVAKKIDDVIAQRGLDWVASSGAKHSLDAVAKSFEMDDTFASTESGMDVIAQDAEKHHLKLFLFAAVFVGWSGRHRHSVIRIGGHGQTEFVQDEFDRCGEFGKRHSGAAAFIAKIMERSQRGLSDGFRIKLHRCVPEHLDVHRARGTGNGLAIGGFKYQAVGS